MPPRGKWRAELEAASARLWARVHGIGVRATTTGAGANATRATSASGLLTIPPPSLPPLPTAMQLCPGGPSGSGYGAPAHSICPQCGQGFTSSWHLREHRRRVHRGVDALLQSSLDDSMMEPEPEPDSDEVPDAARDAAKDIRGTALDQLTSCLLYTSPSPRDQRGSRMPSSA